MREVIAPTEGVCIPKSKIGLSGIWEIEHVSPSRGFREKFSVCNIIVNEGLDYLLDVGLSGGTANAAHYVGIFKGNYTPVATATAATIVTDSTEVVATTDVTATSRVQWVEAGVSSQAITNSASPAVYTFNGTLTVYGLFLISDATMPTPGAGAKLISCVRFPSSRNVVATDTLNITYQLSAADDGV